MHFIFKMHFKSLETIRLDLLMLKSSKLVGSAHVLKKKKKKKAVRKPHIPTSHICHLCAEHLVD